MPRTVMVYKRSGTISASASWELPVYNYKDELKFRLKLTGNPAGTNPTLTATVQARFDDGVWNKVAVLASITGGSSGALYDIVLQELGTFSDSEEASQPSGGTGGTDLTSGVINTMFPPKYWAGYPTGFADAGYGTTTEVGTPGANFRVTFTLGGTNSPSYAITVWGYANEA